MEAARCQGAERAMRCREIAAHFFTSAQYTVGEERFSLTQMASLWHEMASCLEDADCPA